MSSQPPRVIPLACPFRGGSATVFAYYIDAPEPAIVDTAVGPSTHAVLEPALAAAGIPLSDVKWILATHGHWDHIGGAHHVKEITGGKGQVVLHENDVPLLGSRQAHMAGYFGSKFRYVDDAAQLAEADAMILENISGELGADRAIKGGEHFDLGGGHTITAVHTPGHSLGSVSYVLDAPNWAFTGDAVQIYGAKGSVPIFASPTHYRDSIKRLLEDVRPSRILSGHSYNGPRGMFPAQMEGADITAALQASLEMEQRMEEAVKLVKDPSTGVGFAEAARFLGFESSNPLDWPFNVYWSLGGYLGLND